MKIRIFLITAATMAVGCIIAGMLFSGQPATEKSVARIAAAPASKNIQPAEVSPAPPDSMVETNAVVSAAPEKAASQPKPKKQNAGNSATPQPPIQDPDARAALSLVGADPEADAYWLSAISDTSLPDEERADLMEDLNEDGLFDPKDPGVEDLSLIVNRLALIQEIAPQADPFMQEHLGEAYKDLQNMLAGMPVQ